MKFAIVNGKRTEAQPGLAGECPGCSKSMVARCGQIKVPHWAHAGKRVCDPWWENETEWHRTWKGHFHSDWQEIVHEATDGEKHIADVKTDKGWVLEFQHSHIKPEERQSRNSFYQKLAWVVDGTRRKRDQSKFFETLNQIGAANGDAFIGRICTVTFPDESPLIRDWAGGQAPIFFDFGEEHVLWCLLPAIPSRKNYVIEFSRRNFIEVHRNGPPDKDLFDELMTNFVKFVSDREKQLEIQSQRITQMEQAQIARMLDPRPRRNFRL